MYVPSWQGLSPAHLLKSGTPRETAFPISAPRKKYFYVARNGIYHLFRNLDLQDRAVVLAPDYHSGNEVWAMRGAGVQVRYYRIGRNLLPDLNEVEQLCRIHRPRVLYTIHYLGWPQPLPELLELCNRYDMVLVEDCALAMLSKFNRKPLGTYGDYSVFCLYKTLPVPNGGVLAQNTLALPALESLPLRHCGVRSEFGRVLELMLEWYRSRAFRTGRALAWTKSAIGNGLRRARIDNVRVGDIGFDLANVDIGMSSFCESLLRQFDYEAIARKRRDNYLRLAELLDGSVEMVFPQLPKDVCPLFLPILVPNKEEAARELWKHEIAAVQFWNYGDREAMGPRSEDAMYLRRHVLELPIHQDVRPQQLEYIARCVKGLKTALRAAASVPSSLAPATASARVEQGVA